MALLIQNATVVGPAEGISGQVDLLLEHGMITAAGEGLQAPGAMVLDARGLLVCAGLIDMHTHLRDPGQTHKETLETGCRAAAKGGFTSLACMANTDPVTDTPELLRALRARGAALGLVNLYPVGAVTRGLKGQELTDLEGLMEAGALAFSDDGVPIMRTDLLREAFRRTEKLGVPILSHCEDAELVRNYAVNEGPVSRVLEIPGRPAIAEELMVQRDIMLAAEFGAPVHICHVSTKGAIERIRQAKEQGLLVTCETCPHYFALTEQEILTRGTMAKVNPPLRTPEDLGAVLEGLRDGTIDVIATDHAPHAADEKALPLAEAPSGISGLETALAAALTYLYHTGMMSLDDILSKMTAEPAFILGLSRGCLAVGEAADLILFDPDEEWTVDPEQFVSMGHNTPFAGLTLKGRVKASVMGGNVTWKEESIRVL